MSKLSQWQCCVGTQNGPKKWVLCQIPEPWSQIALHRQMLMAIVLSGKKEDLFFPTEAQCLFFT